MPSITFYIIVAALVFGVGGAFLVVMKIRGRKAKIPVIIFKNTGTGIKINYTFGTETQVNTQRMLDVRGIGRKLNYPNPVQFIHNTLIFMQTDEITYRPLLLKTMDNLPKEIKEVVDNLKKKREDGTITKEETKFLTYIETPKLEQEIDKAFRVIFANNVERIVKATTLEPNDFFAKIGKFMPVIIIIATGLFIVFALYGFQPIVNNEINQVANAHLTFACTSASTAGQLGGFTTNTVGTTTIPQITPPAP